MIIFILVLFITIITLIALLKLNILSFGKTKEFIDSKIDSKKQSEIEILGKYIEIIRDGITQDINSLINKKQTKYYIEIEYDDEDYLHELLQNNFNQIHYNGNYLITTFSDKNIPATGVPLIEGSKEHYYINKFYDKIQDEIDYINLEEYFGILEIDLLLNEDIYKVIMSNDLTNKGITFIITNGFKFDNKYKLTNSTDNLNQLSEDLKLLGRELYQEQTTNIVTDKNQSTIILDMIFEFGSTFFYNSIENDSIIKQYTDKNIFEFKKNLNTDTKRIITAIKYSGFENIILFYPTSEELSIFNDLNIKVKRVFIFTDFETNIKNKILITENSLKVNELHFGLECING